jgi:hypothetical protein
MEQLGFRKIVDTTFRMGFLLAADVDLQDSERYFQALRRAQQEIDLEPGRTSTTTLASYRLICSRWLTCGGSARASASCSSRTRARSTTALSGGCGRGTCSALRTRRTRATRTRCWSDGDRSAARPATQPSYGRLVTLAGVFDDACCECRHPAVWPTAAERFQLATRALDDDCSSSVERHIHGLITRSEERAVAGEEIGARVMLFYIGPARCRLRGCRLTTIPRSVLLGRPDRLHPRHGAPQSHREHDKRDGADHATQRDGTAPAGRVAGHKLSPAANRGAHQERPHQRGE